MIVRPMTVLSGSMNDSNGCILLIPDTTTSEQVNRAINSINSGEHNVKVAYDANTHAVVMVRTDETKPLNNCIVYFWSQLSFNCIATVSILNLTI